jgi:hypothetical protein
MRVEKTTVDSVDVDQKQWYRVGGIAALVLGIGYIIIFPLYAHVGAPPSGGDAWFGYLPGKTTFWWAILGLSVFTDFLFVPLALALYLALRGGQQKRHAASDRIRGAVCRLGFGSHLVALRLDPRPLR